MTIKQNLEIIIHEIFPYNSNKLISKPIRLEILFNSSQTFSPSVNGSLYQPFSLKTFRSI